MRTTNVSDSVYCAQLNPVNKNAERISDLKSKLSTLNWGNMTFPVKLKDISKFEKLNPNYAVNAMGLDGTCVYLLRKSAVNTHNQINLLLHDEHYSLINNFGRLVNSQISKHHGARFYCYRCLNSFTCSALALGTVLRTTSLSYGNMPFSGTHPTKTP
jgi:hypothetical protein